jgi:hypothetical protein
MRASLLNLLIAAAVVVGCSRSGDLGTFLVREVTKYGGHTKTNTMPLKLDAHWTVKRDKNGLQVSVTSTSFASIDTFMNQTFGVPKVSVDSNDTGQPHRVWAAADIGVAIQLIGRPGGADIICVRAIRKEEIFEEMEKPWWKKIRLW